MRCLSVFALCVLIAGCGNVRDTQPPRTATEQFLISAAADEAIEDVTVTTLEDRRVFVDHSMLQGPQAHLADQLYLVATLRDALLKGGAKLVGLREQADIIVEVRSGGLSIDRYEFFVGIPSELLGQAIGGAGGVQMNLTQKELALLRLDRQWGFGGIALIAWWRETGELITFSGPHAGQSSLERWKILLLGSRTISDLPTTESPRE